MHQDAYLILIFAAEADYELQAAAVLSGLKKSAASTRAPPSRRFTPRVDEKENIAHHSDKSSSSIEPDQGEGGAHKRRSSQETLVLLALQNDDAFHSKRQKINFTVVSEDDEKGCYYMTSQSDFACKVCHKRYKTSRAVCGHMRMHSNV